MDRHDDVNNPKQVKGIKHDNGKPRPDLIFSAMARALLEVSKVATMGAEKYDDDNWLLVDDAIKRYRDAKCRHMLLGAIEPHDNESGLAHLAHEAWNALAVLELHLRKLETLAEDLGNAQEKDGWTPGEIEAAAFRKSCDSAEVEWPDESRIDVIGQNGNDGAVYSEYTLDEVIYVAVFSDWARWVAVDANGEVWEYEEKPFINNVNPEAKWCIPKGHCNLINKVVRPLNFKNCIWGVNK